jgi:uncharacterized protein with GYD domain
MPHYLIEASYESEGVAGVADKGGTARRDLVGQMISDAGGTMEAFYFAFGDSDVYVIAEIPSNEAAAGISLAINRTSTTKTKTVVLLTPEEIDKASNLGPDYQPPGS